METWGLESQLSKVRSGSRKGHNLLAELSLVRFTAAYDRNKRVNDKFVLTGC